MAGLITDLSDGGALAGDEKVEVSKLSSTVRIAATTLSVDETDNSLNDSGSGLLTAGFAAGDHVNVDGFTNPANNLFFGVISTLTAAKMVIETPEGDNLVTEAAGDSVTISKWISARIDAAEFNLSQGIDVEDDGTLVQLGATSLNFTGAGVSLTDQGGYVVDIDIPGGGGGGSGVDVEDDGTAIQLDATILNFTGAGVTVTDQGGYQVDIDIPGGGSGSGGVDVESDGSVVQLDATILNFIGAVVTDQGGYQVDIDVSGGGGDVFKGALVTKTTTQAVSGSTTTEVTFDSEEYDTNGFHDNVTNNTRLTVPSGVTRVRVSGMATMQSATGQLYVEIAKNGSDFIGKGEADTETTGADSMTVTSAIVDVVPGDYFELRVFTSTAVTLESDCWFALEVIESNESLGSTITETGTSANLLNSNRGRYQRWTATGAKTLTVQPDATEAISQDAEFYITNRAASGNLTISEGSGVTVNPPANGGLVLEPGMAATLKRVAADEFDLIGQTTT